MNEYFELIDDKDIDGDKTRRWIWICTECSALFGSKAIHNRTIFPWFGYHPTDGNCKVITDETAAAIERRVNLCDCKTSIKRVRTVKDLVQAIESHKNES